MGSRRKFATVVGRVIVISMVSVLVGCSAHQADVRSTSSNTPTPSPVTSPTTGSTTQPTPGVTASPSPEPVSTGSSPTANPTSQPTLPAPTAKPQVTGSPKPVPVATAPNFATPVDAQKVIEARAQEAITAIKDKDMTRLASLVHPQLGVQFSPYSYIRTATDIQVQASNLAALWASTSLTHWGTLDGSGDPIDLTFPNYWAKFVYNANFAGAPQISYNTILGKGNMINNVFNVYPTSAYITVEYYFPGFNPQYQGMDWTSLRIIFAYASSQWYLVAIDHDQHTI
ncbi:hypothetical protein [Paenibacillus pectinilyticus]|nr:hypothetical protein [Paenibacillus pectinilyticus]